MKHQSPNYQRAAMFPIIALLIASVAGVVLVAVQIFHTGHWRYATLLWNLVLAWVPLFLALWVCRRDQAGVGGRKLLPPGALWLIFFPNAPYIFTDLMHLNSWYSGHYWIDLTLILLVALTGFLLGFVSLFLMQAVVSVRAGRIVGWAFVLAVAGLSGFGISIGRFLRWNSWDILLSPLKLTHDVGHVAIHPLANSGALAFSVLFGIFLFMGYLMLYALTHLPQPQRMETV